MLGLVGLYVVAMLSGYHQVKEGYVGIYKKLGVLPINTQVPINQHASSNQATRIDAIHC